MRRRSAVCLTVAVALAGVPASRAEPIRHWQVCGPFAAESLLQSVAPSEGGLSPRENRDVGGRSWKPIKTSNGVVLLKGADRMGLEDSQCAFAHTTIRSEHEGDRWILVRSDDSVTVWCNGRRALVHDVLRGMDSGPDRILVHLNEGANDLLLKIFNAGGDWAFSVHLDSE